jgi:pyruvate kinase
MSWTQERQRALSDVTEALIGLRRVSDEAVVRFEALVAERPLEDRPSLLNFVRYLALRTQDMRPLQQRLERLGLSRLGRCESHVLASLDAVTSTLAVLVDDPAVASGSVHPDETLDFDAGPRALAARTARLLGERRGPRHVRIMVTLPSESADDGALIEDLIAAGTDLVRINCAHDDASVWSRMIARVRETSARLDRACRIVMDLGGPKLRTGAVREPFELRVGDRLLVARDPTPGTSILDPEAPEPRLPWVPCQLPEALDHVVAGQRIYFDDGKYEAVIEEVVAAGALVRFTQSRSGKIKLKSDKGINLPDSKLALPALTPKDRADLEFIVRHADLVDYSFVQDPNDLAVLDEALGPAGGGLGVILKIETARAFRALPRLLLASVGRRPVGVMIARGDLAVEVGYERLAEVQEEILWLCEAAHVPVIWATQVLERLARKGMPTRAEITDAAMSERAECVMLNKGEHILDAVRLLDGILSRMEGHQHKKAPLLRPLAVAADALAQVPRR